MQLLTVQRILSPVHLLTQTDKWDYIRGPIIDFCFVSCFNIGEVLRSAEKWNWHLFSFLPFIFVFEQCVFSAVCLRFCVNYYWIVNIVHSFHSDKKSYADAKETCETSGSSHDFPTDDFTTGRLVEPKTKSFNDKVYAESIVAFGGTPASSWIGINGISKGVPWVYTSSDTELVFENWHLGGPSTNGDCTLLKNEKWFAYPCNHKIKFICEFVYTLQQWWRMRSIHVPCLNRFIV